MITELIVRWRFCLYVCCLLISACSAFHLRGMNQLPPCLHRLYLDFENPYGEFETNLQRSLSSSHIDLVSSPNRASFILKVSKPLLSTHSSTIGTSNQTRVYTVIYQVNLALEDAQGKALTDTMILRSVRTITVNANQMLESTNQLSLLEKEMQRDIISQLYMRLGSQQIFLLCDRIH